MFDLLCLLFIIVIPVLIICNYQLGRVIGQTMPMTAGQIVTRMDIGGYAWKTYLIVDIVAFIYFLCTMQFSVVIVTIIMQIIVSLVSKPFRKKVDYINNLNANGNSKNV